MQRHVWTRHCRLLDPQDVRRAWGSEAYCLAELRSSAPQAGDDGRDLVVLVHGLARTRRSMSPLGRALESAGLRVARVSYPSTRASIATHADTLGRWVERLSDVDRVSFVTHSLGGRVVLDLLGRPAPWEGNVDPGRVVQIAPPNAGSELARIALAIPGVGFLLGPSLRDLASTRAAPLRGDLDVAVVAGARGDPEGWNPWLPGDDDGTVAVHETRLEGIRAHDTVPALHTFILNHPATWARVVEFLDSGTGSAPSLR